MKNKKEYEMPAILWLATLPSKIADEAITNVLKSKSYGSPKDIDEIELTTKVSHVLYGAFTWQDTEQGHDYWSNLVAELHKEGL